MIIYKFSTLEQTISLDTRVLNLIQDNLLLFLYSNALHTLHHGLLYAKRYVREIFSSGMKQQNKQ